MNFKMSLHDLYIIRKWLRNNIFMNEQLVFSEDRFLKDRDGNEFDILDVITSLYELVNIFVEGEEYDYFFHFTNKVDGSLVYSDFFLHILAGGKNDGN